jgi:anti-sigma regulatory factor (Ser/Thr protein kinase)
MSERRHTGDAVCASLPREPGAAAIARRALERQLPQTCGHEVVDDAKTIASELVNNAFVHGRGQITLRVRVADDRLRIGVRDDGKGARLEVRQGHGLQIVEALSVEWGASDFPTQVWAELILGHDA